jgi:diguanylate cyclase (GGDEF)-like protein
MDGSSPRPTGLLDVAPAWLVVAIALVLMGLIALGDYATGPDVSFSFFYVIPIGIVALRLDRASGSAMAFLGATVWFLIDHATARLPFSPAIQVWNTLIRLAFFIVIASLIDGLHGALMREAAAARTDHLTGLPNRRMFTELAERELIRSRRAGEDTVLALIDLDEFKRINDEHGHDVGDAALRMVGKAMQGSIRSIDVIARFGGDEFAALVAGKATAAHAILNRLAGAVRSTTIEGASLRASIGAVVVHNESLEHALARADSALYSAKRAGKNRIELVIEPDRIADDAFDQ